MSHIDFLFIVRPRPPGPLWVVWHLLRGISVTFDLIRRQSFPKKKPDSQNVSSPEPCGLLSVLRFPNSQSWCQASQSCFFPACLFVLLLFVITLTHCTNALILNPYALFALKGLWKHPLLTSASLLLSPSLRKLNSDFFRSQKAAGRARCWHIDAIDEKNAIQDLCWWAFSRKPCSVFKCDTILWKYIALLITRCFFIIWMIWLMPLCVCSCPR